MVYLHTEDTLKEGRKFRIQDFDFSENDLFVRGGTVRGHGLCIVRELCTNTLGY